MRHLINIVEQADQEFYYLRLGDLPKGGRSQIGAAPNWIAAMMQKDTHELGISVYPVTWDAKINRWIIDCDNPASLDEMFAQKRPAYLVTGEEVEDERGWAAEGMDGEPLLKDVKILKTLEYKELYYPGWGRDPLPEEYLIDYDTMSEEEHRAFYIERANFKQYKGRFVFVYPDGRVELKNQDTYGEGDLFEEMGLLNRIQGPSRVTSEFRGQQWQTFWGNEPQHPINPLACQITGHDNMRGILVLYQPD